MHFSFGVSAGNFNSSSEFWLFAECWAWDSEHEMCKAFSHQNEQMGENVSLLKRNKMISWTLFIFCFVLGFFVGFSIVLFGSREQDGINMEWNEWMRLLFIIINIKSVTFSFASVFGSFGQMFSMRCGCAGSIFGFANFIH